MPRVIVEDHSGLIWRGANIEILIDGVERAKIKRNLRADFTISAGRHTIQLRTIGALSKPHHFNVAERESLTYACASEGFLKKTLTVTLITHQRHQDRFQKGDQRPGGHRSQVSAFTSM
jgi:hypothetical protein